MNNLHVRTGRAWCFYYHRRLVAVYNFEILRGISSELGSLRHIAIHSVKMRFVERSLIQACKAAPARRR